GIGGFVNEVEGGQPRRVKHCSRAGGIDVDDDERGIAETRTGPALETRLGLCARPRRAPGRAGTGSSDQQTMREADALRGCLYDGGLNGLSFATAGGIEGRSRAGHVALRQLMDGFCEKQVCDGVSRVDSALDD